VFENVLKDIAFQHYNSETAKTVRRMHGKQWEHDPFEGWRPPDFKPKKKGRTPQQAQWKRQQSTIERDWNTWKLRNAGHSYQEIADALGYAHRQSAYKAVARAQRELLTYGRERTHQHSDPIPRGQTDSLFTCSGSSARGRKFPRIDPESLGMKVRRAGVRKCGCFLAKGDRVALLNGRQWCVRCALDKAGLSWWDAVCDPELFAMVKLYPGKNVRRVSAGHA
jgi:hypothetical protein